MEFACLGEEGLEKGSRASGGCVSTTPLLNRKLEGGKYFLELASIYRPTKYHLPVSVTNPASPCLAAPSSVYPLRLPITIHLPYRTTSRQPAKTPQVEIRPAAHPQRSLAHPQTTPFYGPRVPISTTSGFIPEFHSESRRPSRPNAEHHFRNPNAKHILSRIRTPDTPNFRRPGTCHRKAMMHLRRMGQPLALHRLGT